MEEILQEFLSYDFDAFVEEKLKLKANLKKLKETIDSVINKESKSDDKTTFLISYLISSYNIANEIDYLVDWSRQTTLEALIRIFLENYAEYYQLAIKFNHTGEIQKEVNYLYFREIRRCVLSLQRTTGSTSMQDKDDLIKRIKETMRA